MPLTNVFEKTMKEYWEEGKRRGWKPLFTEEEGIRASNEINAEVSEYNRDLKRIWTPPTGMLILYPCNA